VAASSGWRLATAFCYGNRGLKWGRATAILRTFTRRCSGSQRIGCRTLQSTTQWKVQQEFASEVKIRRARCVICASFRGIFFSVSPPGLMHGFAPMDGPQNLLFFDDSVVVVRGRFWKESFPPRATVSSRTGTFPEFMDLLMGPGCNAVGLPVRDLFLELATERILPRASLLASVVQVSTRDTFSLSSC